MRLEEKIKKLKVRGLERQTLELLKTTRWGRIYAAVYLLVGIASIFVYAMVLELNIIFSILLGIATWFVLAFMVDTILIKTQRVDKQLSWMLKTPEGLAELKRRGVPNSEAVSSVTISDINLPITPVKPLIKKQTADLNKDGRINLFDISVLLFYRGKPNPEKGDLNNDGVVDLHDFAQFLYW